ncbi:acyl-CoA dehydrogenase family protein [Croceicoccus marinus]|uniref:Acyl-CoA dehydrogenase n=1 Tax=Croceicoccus marinus TaxID=450378 RepID=A0A1Z1F892_9SPHN|nr:acyl-CoA dehydrogenase family protein [Croceicoccus marinus]ARU15010.1 hypothetical protein A9D14_01000 [Croceicoccus marinus]
MRANLPPANLATVARQIELSHRIADVRAARAAWDAASPDMCEAILGAAAKFAADVLEPLNRTMDADGVSLVAGRVVTSAAHREAWQQYVDAGWPTLEAEEDLGGQDMPAILAFAAQELFDRACPAFGMLPVPQRSAFRLIRAFGDDNLKSRWLNRLVSGEWGATICVSEAGAGSDLRRIRTVASRAEDEGWLVTGNKAWISFGDHDLAEQIGHVVLARTTDAEGKSRPSLFLVPLILPDGSRNAVAVHRIEEKLGLHGSPTCELGFEQARGILLGQEGRGLAQLFVMIANMRMAVGAMGTGIASGATDLAMRYAEERLQGGSPDPVAIARHADVQLQLLDLMAPTILMRGLLFAVANCNDLASQGDTQAQALGAWLLPIVKTTGGETAFDVASGAIQVLGGAGYTSEWPAEQFLRDARVLTVFEGTTGMQAQDLVLRRLVDDRSSFDSFMTTARGTGDARLESCLDVLDQAARTIAASPECAEGGATAMLHIAATAALAWIAAGYLRDGTSDAMLIAASEHWLDNATARASRFLPRIAGGKTQAARYAALRETLS